MPMSDKDLADLDASLRKARKKPIAFGLCLGKKPEDNVFYLDMKKSPEVVMRRAKADGETAKLTNGFASLKGKILSLSLEGKMLPGLAKNMKTFMSKNGQMLKVVITDPNGNVLEDDEDGENEDQASANARSQQDSNDPDAGNAQSDDPNAGIWNNAHGRLDPLVARFGQSGHVKAAAIVTAWDRALASAKNADYASAIAAAKKIDAFLSTASDLPDEAQTQPDPNAGKWAAAHATIEALFKKAMGNNPANRTNLEAAWALAIEKAEGGDFVGGIKVLKVLKPKLDDAISAGTSDQEQTIPKDVVLFQKSRILWSNSRAKMRAQLQVVVDAIKEACAGDDEMADIAAEAPQLLNRLDVFDDQLETILDDITNSEQGPGREALKAQAVTKIAEYRDALTDDFFKDVDSGNGFANVSVTATAQADLEKISKVLAA